MKTSIKSIINWIKTKNIENEMCKQDFVNNKNNIVEYFVGDLGWTRWEKVGEKFDWPQKRLGSNVRGNVRNQ